MDNKEKIEAIRNLPNELNAAINGLSPAQLDTPYREGGWTARQIVHHIADSHINAFIRMKLVLTEDHPTVKPYDQDSWAKMNDYTRDIAPSLAIVSGVQERMANLLDDAADADFSRTLFHPENGEMTLQNLLDMYSTHGRHHIEQIKKIPVRE
jgi:uncharacterized damage-inducible protein DinB